jgi:ketosteroid isomerase-like protein
MAVDDHRIAQQFVDAVVAGELPESLVTEDFSAWLTTQGPVPGANYRGAFRMLARMCDGPLSLTVDAVTAEDDRVLVEAHSSARLINGESYENTYVFSLRVRDGRIAWVAEHFNALVVAEKLMPLVAQLTQGRGG